MNTTFVGQALDRVDGRLKVTGQAQYSADIALPHLAHAIMVSASISHGHIQSIDTTQAEAAPGVLLVMTPFTAPRLVNVTTSMIPGATTGKSFLPLQDSSILFYGQPIAIVVAETHDQASYAGSLIHVIYKEEKPVTRINEARQITPATMWGRPADTLQGDIKQGLAEAAAQVDQHYITAMQHHNAMEMHATIASWENDCLTVYDTSSWVYGARKTLATWLALPEEKIRVIARFVGGAFGGYKGLTWPHSAFTALAAKIVQRPVKLTFKRSQEFAGVGYRPEVQHHIQLAATSTGQLTAIVHDAIAQTAEGCEEVVAPVTKTTRKLYACPNVATTYRLAQLNLSKPTTMRGPGETLGVFAVEAALDELAYELKMDPLALRLRNYAEVDPETGYDWSSKALRECYQQGAERFGWHKRTPEPGSMSSDDALIGWGMATAAYDVRLVPAAASARITQDGHVLVQSATCDQGTGSYTIMRQIAADALNLPIDSVTFELGDTTMPIAPVSAGSFTAASIGTAVMVASQSLRRQLLELAQKDPKSPLYGINTEHIIVHNGICSVKDHPEQQEAYTDILKRHNIPEIAVTERIQPSPHMEKDQQKTHYMFGAHFVEVQIHPILKTIRITRYVARFGAGRILNPKTAHSQLIGGIIWGIGMALMEQTILDEKTGRLINTDLAEYHVPVNADIPAIDADFVHEDDFFVNPLGVKGIGEIGTIGSAAAIANAIYHATGKRIRSLPITLDTLL